MNNTMVLFGILLILCEYFLKNKYKELLRLVFFIFYF